jgi:hypothetical protein
MSTKDSEDASTLDKAAADLILPAKNAEDENTSKPAEERKVVVVKSKTEFKESHQPKPPPHLKRKKKKKENNQFLLPNQRSRQSFKEMIKTEEKT